MDNNNKNEDFIKTPLPEALKHIPSEAAVKPFENKHWILVLLAFIFSLGIITVFDFRHYANMPYLALPGAPCTVLVLTYLASVLIFYRHELHPNKQNIFMLAVCVLTSLTYSIFSNAVLRLMNYPVMAGTAALALYSLMGHSVYLPTEANAPWEALSRFIPSLFANAGRPVSELANGRHKYVKSIGIVLLTLVLCVPLIAIVLALLSSADVVFEGMLEKIGELFTDINGARLIWRIICCTVLTVMIFSVSYGFGLALRSYEKHEDKSEHTPLAACVVLILLDIIYILFVAVQFTYFFGGRETALMEGGYAEYARSGFFQLVAVSMINIVVIAIVNRFFKHNTPITILSMLLDLATGIILVSATWRVVLYINVYGMSFLRILTLWGIFVIAAAIVLTGIKMVNAEVKVFPVFITIFLVSWLAFNYMNTDRVIAKYNVDMYLDGRSESVDIEYLQGLSSDVIPELERLEENGKEEAENAVKRMSRRGCTWREWSFSELHKR